MIRKQSLLLGLVAAVALVIGGTFAVMAQSPSPTPAPTGTAKPSPTPAPTGTVKPGAAKLAANLGVTPDKLKTARQQTATQLIDERIAAGKITPAQAAAMKQRIAQGNIPFSPHHAGKRGQPHGNKRGTGIGVVIHTLGAEAIGIDAATLRTEMQSGKSLAQIAQAHGKSRDAMKATLLAKAGTKLDALVASGKITAEQKQSLLTKLTQHMDQTLDRTGGPKAFGAPGQRPPRARPSATATATATS